LSPLLLVYCIDDHIEFPAKLIMQSFFLGELRFCLDVLLLCCFVAFLQFLYLLVELEYLFLFFFELFVELEHLGFQFFY
jgi:hypothetical protein